MEESKQRYYCALATCHNIPPRTRQALLHHFGSIEALFEANNQQLRQAGIRKPLISNLQNIDWNIVDQACDWLSAEQHHLLSMDCDAYPESLKQIADPPFQLFVDGDPAVLSAPQISMVGSRRATAAGKKLAQKFAAELVALGFVITSGLAFGIDQASHQGALQSAGKTIAVLGNGIDNVYPVKNLNLAKSIRTQGAVISEYPPSTLPLARNFPQRNRIISGLSHGTLVVEAAQRSGSLITARFAMEQGREVFAIPGSILNIQTRGCHDLIQQGAKLVYNCMDILLELRPDLLREMLIDQNHRQTITGSGRADSVTTQLLDIIGFDPISVDMVIEQSGLTAEKVSSILLEMELSGIIQTQPGGNIMRVA